MANTVQHRKIPFKTPMLYLHFSDYGYRKYPKTGVKTAAMELTCWNMAGKRSINRPGTVVFAGNEVLLEVVRIEHNYGISTLYAISRITVRVGDYVGENAVIGKMGNTGRSAARICIMKFR